MYFFSLLLRIERHLRAVRYAQPDHADDPVRV